MGEEVVSPGVDDVSGAAQDAQRHGYTPASLRVLNEAVQEYRDRIAALTVERFEATDETGTVTAEVTGDAQLQSVYISPHAVRGLDAAGLGEACRQAILAARGRMTERIQEEMAASAGGELTPPPIDVETAAARLRRAAERLR
ncbi:YbaB/EbfC family nucleoid-associated protein [Actinoplanes sp. NPDC051851]|uniref:YbaB/EbfC family nucleoid-associated protein n=1 Tax=Actinoplanes sp. NPDC051851 TaxID=3154753 RepID=UPI00342C969D